MSQDNQEQYIFNDSQIANLGGFLDALKQVHVRLINEGYQIKDDKITPPKIKEKEYEQQKLSQ